jgi:hypothetical protein
MLAISLAAFAKGVYASIIAMPKKKEIFIK